MLKKLIAILLLVIYLYNLGGYTLVFRYYINQSAENITAQIDDNKYKETDLVQMSIPLHLPYLQNSAFENINGSVEVNGIFYNYVKKRISNDTLYVLCLPNHQSTKLLKEKSSYAGEVNDFASPKKEKVPAAKKAGAAPEYSNTITQYSILSLHRASITQSGFFSCFIPSRTIDIAGQPPESSC